MKTANNKPASVKTPQNEQAPQDESPLSKPEKNRKNIIAEKQRKASQVRK